MRLARAAFLTLGISVSCVACAENKPPLVDASPPPSPSATLSEPSDSAAPADAGLVDAGPHAETSPYGKARRSEEAICGEVTRRGHFAQFVAVRDMGTSFVDGDDLLALVNRAPVGTLAPTYSPSDLVDVRSGEPRTTRECETKYACLRAPAQAAMKEMLAAMLVRGYQGRVDSAFRSYANQCATFVRWADKPESTFCSATEQSALAGHSQHQLGTTVDMFTEEWASGDGGIFRDGFGCTSAAIWLTENSYKFGYVFPYPIHPDDRAAKRCAARWDVPIPINPKTGYKHEAWHLRFIGKENAERFHADLLASGPDTPSEITLEQWIRQKKGLEGDADLPVCDGCACGACATLATDEDKPLPCKESSITLGEDGRPRAPEAAPRLLDARVSRRGDGVLVLELKVAAPPHTLTQPPVLGPNGPHYSDDVTFEALVPYLKTAAHRYPDLKNAWRIGVEAIPPKGADQPIVFAGGAPRFPWRAAIADARLGRTWNRANLYLPAAPGESWIKIGVRPHEGARALKVTLLRGGEDSKEHDTREVALPKK